MTKIGEKKQYYGRLEEVMRIANEGKRVDMEVELKKLPIIHESHAKEEHYPSKKINTYLLMAYYNFKIDDQSHRISKVYMIENAEGSLNALQIDEDIANARLRVDYKRLKDAHINFHEKFF